MKERMMRKKTQREQSYLSPDNSVFVCGHGICWNAATILVLGLILGYILIKGVPHSDTNSFRVEIYQ